MLEIILSVLITIVMGFFAFVIFILAQHKEEIWKHIKFKDEE